MYTKLLKRMYTTQPNHEEFKQLIEAGASPAEIGNYIRGHLHRAYDEAPEKATKLALRYLQLFVDEKNFPVNIFFMAERGFGTKFEYKDAPLSKMFNHAFPDRYSRTLKVTVSSLFVDTPYAKKRRKDIREGKIPDRLRKAVAAALNADFSEPVLSPPPGTKVFDLGGGDLYVTEVDNRKQKPGKSG